MTLPRKAIEAGAKAMWDSLKGDTHSGIAWDHHGMPIEQRERFTRMSTACLTAALAAEGMVMVPSDALSYARQMSNLCFNYKQSPSCDQKLREAMDSAHSGFDRAMLSAYGGEDG